MAYLPINHLIRGGRILLEGTKSIDNNKEDEVKHGGQTSPSPRNREKWG